MTARHAEARVRVLEPRRGWIGLDLADLWWHRAIVSILALRDIKIRYKQTAFGVAWALLQPLLATAIFSVILGRLVGLPSDGTPYPLFALAGFVAWTYISSGVSSAGLSLVRNASLVSKVYVPRLLIPAAGVLPGLLDLGIGLGAVIVVAAAFGALSSVSLLAIPVALALLIVIVSGTSIWLSALDVRYRDVRHALPFLLQVWLFASPVVYPASLVPADLRLWYAVNPVVGALELLRWSLFATTPLEVGLVIASSAVALAVLASGLVYFRLLERTFADSI